METNLTCNSSFWTREEDKAFEKALATYAGDICPWEKIAAAVPGRTVDEIKNHFKVLVSDINAIDSGDVPLPQYADSFEKPITCADHSSTSRKRRQSVKRQNPPDCEALSSKSDGGRKRGKLWTEEEHSLFIFGLENYGRSDWRSISRHCVKTRTPTQVASHAQKYFKYLEVINNSKKKMSIDDLTILDNGKLLTQNVSAGQTSGIGGISGVNTRSCQKFDDVAINLVSSSSTSQIDIPTAQWLNTEEVIRASGAHLISHSMPNLNGVSISQETRTGQSIGASSCLIAHGMPNLHGISIYKGPDANMIGAANVGFISSHQGTSIPQAPITNMIRAADAGFIAGSQGMSILQNPSTNMIRAADVGFIASSKGMPIPQAPSTAHMLIRAADVGFIASGQDMSNLQAPSTNMMRAANVGFTGSSQSMTIPEAPSTAHRIEAANVGFISSHPGISMPHAPGTANMTGAADVGFISRNQGTSIPHAPSAANMTGPADVGFISSNQGISIPQAPSWGQVTGATSVGASLNTGQQSVSTLQGPIPAQEIADAGGDSNNPMITSLHDKSTSHGQPDTGKMIENDVDDYIIDFEDSSLEYILSILDSPAASPPAQEPSTSAAVSGSLPSPSPLIYDFDAPSYGSFNADDLLDMDYLTY